MSADSAIIGTPRALETILLGWLAVGILDMFDAYFFFGFYYNISFFQVFQGVAAGLYGTEAARAGGTTTGLIGLALHYVVALGVAVFFYILSNRFPRILREPVAWGMLYGVGVHLFMQYVVIPLSASGRAKSFDYWAMLNNVVGHALLIGLPVALIAYWSARRNTPRGGDA
ncbi:MAG TPA: hypothetical protein VGO50_10365 [Pyrinomonadaceae bacterium]|jgi:uncharacterized membrane protein YagU involved in acid resistance|nr:hypothetical protein [Pyrinomonadaceae bacterium]